MDNNKENPTNNNKENCANNNKENCANNNKENPTDTTTKNCNCCKFIRNTILIIFSIITVAIIVIFSILLRNNTHINIILIILTILLLSCIGIIFYYIKRHYDSIEKDSQLRAKLETDKLYNQLRIQKSNFYNTIEVIESLKSQL